MCSLLRCNVDGGGTGRLAGSIKLSVSFIDITTPHATEQGFLNTGTRAVQFLAIATGSKESYDTVQQILQLVDFATLRQMFPKAKLMWQQDMKMNWIFT